MRIQLAAVLICAILAIGIATTGCTALSVPEGTIGTRLLKQIRSSIQEYSAGRRDACVPLRIDDQFANEVRRLIMDDEYHVIWEAPMSAKDGGEVDLFLAKVGVDSHRVSIRVKHHNGRCTSFDPGLVIIETFAPPPQPQKQHK